MKIEVLQEQLLSGLAIVGRAVASRAQLPILSHVLIEADKEGIVLSATDLEIGIKVRVTAKVVEEGVFAVPAKMLEEFLSSLSPGRIEIATEKESLYLIAPGYKGKFQTINADEFPRIPAVDKTAEICKIDSKVFSEAIERVVFASARDSLRPVLTGVLWEFREKGVRLVATDGFRLAIEELATVVKVGLKTLLVPSRVVSEVVKLVPSGEISVGHLESTNQIYFMTSEVQIVSQLLSGNFPDYQKILPKEFGSEIKISKSELTQALRAAHIFARDNSNMVRWNIGENNLTLISTSPEKGECSIEVPIKLEGDEIEIIFNAKYVLDYLGISTSDELLISLGGKLAPGMIKDIKRESGQYIVMPINA